MSDNKSTMSASEQLSALIKKFMSQQSMNASSLNLETTSTTTRTKSAVKKTTKDAPETQILAEQIGKIREYNRLTEQINSKFCSEFNMFPNLTEILKLSRRTNYFKLSKLRQRKIKDKIKEALLESSQFLKNMGLSLNSVEINPLEKNECNLNIYINERPMEAKQPNKNNLLFLKDKHSVSS